jgi:hypothetical protein
MDLPSPGAGFSYFGTPAFVSFFEIPPMLPIEPPSTVPAIPVVDLLQLLGPKAVTHIYRETPN